MEQNTPPVNYNLPEEDNVDIKRYISLFLSNWYWFATALFIALTLAYSINRYSQRIYSLSATLLIKDDQLGSVNNNVTSVIPGGDIFKNQQNLKNEIGILQSFYLNYMAIKKLQDFAVIYVGVGRRNIVEREMYKSCPFIVKYDSLSAQLMGVKVNIKILSDEKYRLEINNAFNIQRELRFGEKFTIEGFDFAIEPRFKGIRIFDENSSNKYYFYFVSPEGLANQYRNSLSVVPIEKDASLVTLSKSGFVPEQQADYLNNLMEVYLDYGLEIKNQTATKTIQFIDKQLGLISDSLTLAEGKLEKFRLDNSFFDLSLEGTRVQNRLEKFENERASFNLQLQYYNYLSDYLKNRNVRSEIVSPSVMGIADPVLLRLVDEISAMQKEKEKLGFNIVGDQPALSLIDVLSEETRKALEENIKNGIAGLTLLIAETGRKIAVVETEINRFPTTERKLINIQRQFDLNNTVYTYLLEKRAESGIAKASNIADNRVIDLASGNRSSQIRPKSRSNYILAFVFALLLPMLSILLIDFFNDKVIDKKDIERKTKVPIIGFISHNSGTNEMPVVEKPSSSLAESFRAVRTSIKYFVKENEKPVIAVTSTISAEGKTFISINLAAITAMLGKKVLLIGLDLRKPRIDKVFEFDDSPGMSTYLSSNCDYKEIIKKTQIDNLFYVPSGPVPPNPAELIERDQMKKFMERAKKEFDFIIIDTPPVAVVTDTLLLAPYVDLNLFVVRQRYTSRNTLEMVEHLSKSGELKNLAIIINDINISGYYGYGMRYGNSLGYGYSYGYNYYGKEYYGRYSKQNNIKDYYSEK
ncbi:MAG: polysaccharide biosynthesis tyrosine autokinase [Bacteroidia bacterium]|nr:polysaccharide biosynthesis tyrosine autokinase [Bacteroidia bacterium]